jgi:hypothetical protein
MTSRRLASFIMPTLWLLAGAPIGQAQQSNLDGIELSVVDLTNGQPIVEFRVIAGIPAGQSITRDFQQRGGGEVINWQPHTAKLGRGGNFVWPLARGWDDMALRIESDGYEPQRRWIRRPDGPKHLVIQLEKDPGIDVLVLQPDGNPAAGASIATVLPQREAHVQNGLIKGDGLPLPDKPGDRWRRPTIVHTDAQGRARVATETDAAAAVVVVHETGVREASFEQFRQLKRVDLRRWGRVEGRILWQDKPGANERVSLSIYRHEYGYPGMISSSADAGSDAEGRFVFEKVLPGHAQISRPIRLPEKGELGIQDAIFDGLVFHIDVASDKPTSVLIGGRGRKITGRLVGRANWQDVTMHFHPEAPHIGMPGDETMWQAFGVFRESAIGPLFFRDQLKPDPTGAFEFPHVLPGRYQLFVSAPGAKEYIGSHMLNIPPESPEQEPAAMDVGAIEVKKAQP